jgi:hypothetical protein
MEWVGNVGQTHILALTFRPIMILGTNSQTTLSVGVSSYKPLGVVGNPFPWRLSCLLTVPCFVLIFFIMVAVWGRWRNLVSTHLYET